jgi:hypothetical protein
MNSDILFISKASFKMFQIKILLIHSKNRERNKINEK